MSGSTTSFFRGENPLRADKLNTAFSERVQRAGDTMQGRLNLVGDPVAPLEAATKQYVDRFTSMGVPTGAYIGSAPPGNVLGPLWWDNVSGQLFIQYNDGSSTQWVSANSIDASTLEGSFLPITGGHVTGKLQVGSTGWLEAIIGATEAISDFVSLSKIAGPGGVFGTRTSDGGATGGMGAWSIGAFAINNNTTAVQNAYGIYVESRRYPNTGVAEGIEISIVNEGDVKQSQPYYIAQAGSTIGLFLGAGRDDVTPNNDCTMALGITGGNAKWDRGIIFDWGSVRSRGPTGPVAIALPHQYAITWYVDDGGASQGVGVPGAFIRSDATSVSGLAHPPALVFGNGSLVFDPGNNVISAAFEVGKNSFTGKLNLANLPTSATGLSAGDVWRNGTALVIV